MDIKKSIQLTTQPLEYLLQHGESIDFRLDEPVWGSLRVGDVIEFWEDFSGWDVQPCINSRRVVVRIEDIIRASNFAELINILPDSFTSKESKEDILSDLRQWWTAQQEKDIGVLGLKVKVINN